MDFGDLSPQVLSLIVQNLALEQLEQLCSLKPELEEKICKNEEFWQHKYLQEFGVPKISPLIWRETYRQKYTNQVLAFGWNQFGQLGLGDEEDRWRPERIFFPKRIISISAGRIHSLILTEEGEVYAFGLNSFGQLGFEDRQSRLSPERISLLEKITAISTGAVHSLILTEDGQVYAFGSNRYGQLGLGDELNRSTPERIPFFQKISSISAGGYHNLILAKDGQVYVFGWNDSGQLGLGDRQDRFVPERIPFGLKPKEKIREISTGERHSLILTGDGQVYAFGRNKHGQLGLGDQQERWSPERIPLSPKIVAVSVGSDHSLILTENSSVYAFGRNNSGQLGLGDQQDRWSPELISFELKPKEKITVISAGAFHSLILTEDGEVYAFGLNKNGQLGLGDQQNRWSPEKISFGLKPKEKIIVISAGIFHSLILAGEYALFSSIETLIQKNWVKGYKLKYQTSENTAVVEFIDLQGQSYLIEVRYDPVTNQIFPIQN